MKTNTDKELKRMVDNIAKELSTKRLDAYEYIEEALDIRYIVGRDKQCISGQVLVAFGGPNIWVNFDDKSVIGYWGGDKVVAEFIDRNNIEDVICDLYGDY